MSYHRAVEEVVQLYRSATPEQLATTVPSTPAWTTNDLLAHLVAGARRNLAGVDAPPTDAEANAEVLAVRDAGTRAMLAELQQDAVLVRYPTGVPSTHWDIVCHLADAREALGLPELGDTLWRPVLHEALAFDDQVGRLSCRVEVEGFTCGREPLVRAAEGYPLFRALFGRLPLDQLDADGDVELLRPAVFFA